jgi:hypothetical protein
MTSPSNGAWVIRARVGLSPTRPQHDAGIRIEPPPSFPCAIATIPDATAAAEPPLDPPGVRVLSHGFRVAPKSRGSVVGRKPNSGQFVFPRKTSPADR